MLITMDHCRHTLTHPRSIHDEENGDVQKPSHLSRASIIACLLPTIKKPHYSFNNRNIRILYTSLKAALYVLGPIQPGIQVVGGTAGCATVIGGINIVRTNFKTLYSQPTHN